MVIFVRIRAVSEGKNYDLCHIRKNKKITIYITNGKKKYHLSQGRKKKFMSQTEKNHNLRHTEKKSQVMSQTEKKSVTNGEKNHNLYHGWKTKIKIYVTDGNKNSIYITVGKNKLCNGRKKKKYHNLCHGWKNKKSKLI